MKLIITTDRDTATTCAAHKIAHTIDTAGKRSVLGLATGRTMEGIYACLASWHAANKLDFSDVTSFNLDEYVGLSAEDPRSYHHYMQEHLFRLVNIPGGQTHLPDGAAKDLAAECASYESAIRDVGGIDLQLLGIGDTGHIGFNEPPSAFDTRTRCVELDHATRRQNAEMFGGDPEAVPTHALTMGVGTILDARRLVMVALGPAKAAIVAQALEGDITPDVSASAIRLHPDCTVILDRDSAANLSEAILQNAERND